MLTPEFASRQSPANWSWWVYREAKVEVASPLRAAYRELFVGLINGQLNDPRRRDRACILLTSVAGSNGAVLGRFETFIAKPTDHVSEETLTLGTSVGLHDVIDAMANLGIDQQLDEVEGVIEKNPTVNLTMSVSMLPFYDRAVATFRAEIDLTRPAG
jgi:hypothetical protein